MAQVPGARIRLFDAREADRVSPTFPHDICVLRLPDGRHQPPVQIRHELPWMSKHPAGLSRAEPGYHAPFMRCPGRFRRDHPSSFISALPLPRHTPAMVWFLARNILDDNVKAICLLMESPGIEVLSF